MKHLRIPRALCEELAVIFWSRVSKAEGDACWLWSGRRLKRSNGHASYGVMPLGPRRAVPIRCAACRMALLSTEELGEISREELYAALEEGNAQAVEDELYRHQMARERWSLAVQRKRLIERDTRRRAKR